MKEVSLHEGEVLSTVENSSVLACTTCGFAHVTPLPSKEELQKFYEKEFYDNEWPDYFKNAEEDMAWWMATYDHYYDLIETHTKGRNLLDIGSGPGYFLDAGKKRGWNVIGFEPSRAATEYSRKRGLTIVNEVFTKEEASKYGPFDVVMLSLVLEHIPDPASLIEEAKQVLVPGGVLVVIVPNDYNPLQKLLVAQHGFTEWWVVPTHHLNYFSIASLTSLLTSHGLTTETIETSYPMEFFLLSGRNYVGNPALGRTCHEERKAFEMALFSGNRTLLSHLYQGWAKQGIGREIVVITKKAA